MATVEAVNAMNERLLLVETLVQRHIAQFQALSDQQTVQMKSHQSMHEEVKKLVDRVTGTAYATGRVDKMLLPSRYSGDKSMWRMFSSKLVSCLSKAHPGLKDAMSKEMGSNTPITPDKLLSNDLTDEA